MHLNYLNNSRLKLMRLACKNYRGNCEGYGLKICNDISNGWSIAGVQCLYALHEKCGV